MISLNPGEKIIKIYRRHWFIILIEIIIFSIVLVIVWSVATYFFINTLGNLKLLPIFIAVILSHIIFVIFYIKLADWWLDTWIVTNERIIDIEQKGFFIRDFSEFKLSKIQNINVEVAGLIPTFLNFGNLKVETASENITFIFREIPNPYEAKNLILKVHDEYVSSHRNLGLKH